MADWVSLAGLRCSERVVCVLRMLGRDVTGLSNGPISKSPMVSCRPCVGLRPRQWQTPTPASRNLGSAVVQAFPISAAALLCSVEGVRARLRATCFSPDMCHYERHFEFRWPCWNPPLLHVYYRCRSTLPIDPG